MVDTINNTETKPCLCGKKMIKRGNGIVFCSMPPKYGMQWRCGGSGCGRTEDAGMQKSTYNYDEYMKKQWEAAQ